MAVVALVCVNRTVVDIGSVRSACGGLLRRGVATCGSSVVSSPRNCLARTDTKRSFSPRVSCCVGVTSRDHFIVRGPRLRKRSRLLLRGVLVGSRVLSTVSDGMSSFDEVAVGSRRGGPLLLVIFIRGFRLRKRSKVLIVNCSLSRFRACRLGTGDVALLLLAMCLVKAVVCCRRLVQGITRPLKVVASVTFGCSQGSFSGQVAFRSCSRVSNLKATVGGLKGALRTAVLVGERRHRLLGRLFSSLPSKVLCFSRGFRLGLIGKPKRSFLSF